MLARLLPRTWNDVLSICIVVGVPVACNVGGFSETVTATLLSGWLLTIQFYFRRSGPSDA